MAEAYPVAHFMLGDIFLPGAEHTDTAVLAPGIYFVRLADETRSGTKRLIVQ